MKRLTMLVMTLTCLLTALPLWGRQEVADAEIVRSEAVKGFEEILNLWRDGNFDELYNRTLISGKDTKESFTRKMSSAKLKPSCCWEKMQEVGVSVRTQTSVVLRAKLGLDAPGEMEYKTKSFKLSKEDGVWRIARSDILSLAEAKKKNGKKSHGGRTLH
ncbi:MAG TPA: hypothetical protein VFF53_08970 [Geobacteraceae bacterium]|nr:hypothetical protein [Geobacteraceae bacterium]